MPLCSEQPAVRRRDEKTNNVTAKIGNKIVFKTVPFNMLLFFLNDLRGLCFIYLVSIFEEKKRIVNAAHPLCRITDIRGWTVLNGVRHHLQREQKTT